LPFARDPMLHTLGTYFSQQQKQQLVLYGPTLNIQSL
jgi:hypothetical protein